jgi:hypothetical protein
LRFLKQQQPSDSTHRRVLFPVEFQLRLGHPLQEWFISKPKSYSNYVRRCQLFYPF